MAYNLTSIGENTTGILGFTQGVNSVLMNDMLGVVFLLGLCFIFFIAFFRATQDVRRSIASTAIVCFALSLLLRAVSLVPDLAVFLALIGAAAGLAIVRK